MAFSHFHGVAVNNSGVIMLKQDYNSGFFELGQ